MDNPEPPINESLIQQQQFLFKITSCKNIQFPFGNNKLIILGFTIIIFTVIFCLISDYR